MERGRYERVREVFLAACELPDDRRLAFVAEACGDDTNLRHEVEVLFQWDAQRRVTLQPPVDLAAIATKALTDAQAPDPPLPQRIGHYRILGLIGEGGMGVVYEAEQESPRRTVALKVMRSGRLSSDALRRFEREAEVLGQLQHPGIAQVFEAGRTEATPHAAAQPFFAMELVRGLPLVQHANVCGLDVRGRLELVAQVCDGVAHAHARGFVHRDLKPANILVDEEGRPKVLDFGIARVTGIDVRTATLQTDPGQLVGTLPYMSPQQVAGDVNEVDARCDVYALGVILFELLAGRLPLDVCGRSIPEAIRVIRDEDPSRLGSVDTHLRGDVETIVAKALEKDLQRRYRSVAELAADIRRYLQHQPIIARPTSAFYQFRKFARRNPALVGGVAGILAAMALGLAGTLWFAMRATEQQHAAQSEAQAARRASYRNAITAADGALRVHAVARARQALGTAPPELRGWEWHYFWNRLDESRLIVQAAVEHWGAAFGDDGRSIELCTQDFPPRLLRWNATTGAPIADGSAEQARYRWFRAAQMRDSWNRSFPASESISIAPPGGRQVSLNSQNWRLAPNTRCWSPRLSPQCGALVFYCPHGSGLQLVNVDENPQRVREITVPTGNTNLVFSSDGKRLLSADALGANLLWDVASGTQLATLVGHTDRVMAAEFDAEGRIIVTASWDQTIRTWDAHTGAPLAVGRGHTNYVDAVTYSPDGRRVVSGGRDGTLRMWDAAHLESLCVLHGHEGDVTSVAFSPDGSRLMSTALDHTIRVWGATCNQDRDVLRGHSRYVYPVAFSPDGSLLATGGWDQTVRLWNVYKRTQVAVLTGQTGNIYHLAFSPDGSRLASADDGETVYLWEIATERLVSKYQNRSGITFREFPIRFHTDGTRILVPGRPGRVTFFKPTSGEIEDAPLNELSKIRLWPHSLDGRLALALDEIGIVDTSSGALVLNLSNRLHRGRRTRLVIAFEPHGKWLVGPRPDNALTILDSRSGVELAVLPGHTDEILAVAVSPDGSRIASAGRDQVIRVWDAQTFHEVAQLEGHTSYVWSLAWSPDGTMLASGSGDHSVRIWDAGIPRP